MTIHTFGFEANAVPAQAKWAFTTRRVDHADVAGLDPSVGAAVAGDLVLCEIAQIGQHQKIQLANGRASASYRGDLVVLCVGDRYAPDQFHGRAEVSPEGADLLAGGGIVGAMEAAHVRMRPPTRVRPIGVLIDAGGRPVNVRSYALPRREIPDGVTVFGVFGASMNAGKTTAAASLAHGLARAGFAVAGVKATGTGAFSDFNAFRDAGVPAADFTDAGMPTTYRMPMDRIEAGFEALVGGAAADGAEIVVVEIADGVFQQETQAILAGSGVRDRLDGVLFAAPDALGAAGGARVLADYGLSPFAISGKVTLSPLAMAEAEAATGVPLLSREELCEPEIVVEAVRGLLRAPRPSSARPIAAMGEARAA